MYYYQLLHFQLYIETGIIPVRYFTWPRGVICWTEGDRFVLLIGFLCQNSQLCQITLANTSYSAVCIVVVLDYNISTESMRNEKNPQIIERWHYLSRTDRIATAIYDALYSVFLQSLSPVLQMVSNISTQTRSSCHNEIEITKLSKQ